MAFHSPVLANEPLISSKCNEFTFDASKSYVPHSQNISYFWDFGDGHTSVEPVIIHTYEKPGNYTVNLTITDNAGFECSTAMTSQQVHVDIPPEITLSADHSSCTDKSITFSTDMHGKTSKKNLSYSWNFGDGTTSESKRQATKTYTKGGDYKILLTVDSGKDNACNTTTVEKNIHINEPPKADAGQDVILRCVTGPEDMVIDFDASATTDSNDDILSFLWEFGDGNKKEGQHVSHQYKKIGNYDAKLIVSDNTNLHCGTGVDFVTIKLNQAPVADAGGDITVCTQDKVLFDGSKSIIHKKGTEISQWFFGDGNAKYGLKATHRYSSPGIYQATLSLENKLNKMCPISKDTRTITVNSPPMVSIKSQKSQCVGKTVFFDASSAIDSDGDPLNYYWNFGDGATSAIGAKVTHRYNQGGHYRISLVADDQKQTKCSTATAQSKIHINTPPIADAGPNHSCCVGKPASFSASGSSDPDGDQLTYQWDFGDGTTKQGENVTHTYTHEGSYKVVLTIKDHSDSSCNWSTDSFTAVVKEAPLPVISVH